MKKLTMLERLERSMKSQIASATKSQIKTVKALDNEMLHSLDEQFNTLEDAAGTLLTMIDSPAIIRLFPTDMRGLSTGLGAAQGNPFSGAARLRTLITDEVTRRTAKAAAASAGK
jgi:hypothetical protein